jgi:hypothetical protein
LKLPIEVGLLVPVTSSVVMNWESQQELVCNYFGTKEQQLRLKNYVIPGLFKEVKTRCL